MMNVRLGYGTANFSNTAARYANYKVSAPFHRTSSLTSGRQTGNKVSANPGRHSHSGYLVQENVEHPVGTILLLQVSWFRSGAPIRDGALFLKLRDGAPVYNINARVPTDYGNTFGDMFQMFSGMGDVLSVEDLARENIELNASYEKKFMSEDEQEECFSIVQISPGRLPRPALVEIESPTGTVLAEMSDTPVRRLRLRSRG